MTRLEIYKRIDAERDYQDNRWTENSPPDGVADNEKSVAEWLNYIEFHVERAKHRVYDLNKEEALHEIRKVAALAVRALEIHGCPERQSNIDNKLLTTSNPRFSSYSNVSITTKDSTNIVYSTNLCDSDNCNDCKGCKNNKNE